MVTFVDEPTALSLARNPVLLQLAATQSSGVPYAGRGRVSTLTAGATAKFATGNTLSVAWTDPEGNTDTVVFTAAATYTAENQLPDASYSGSIGDYWELVRSKVASHHRVGAYFDVTRTGPSGGNVLRLQERTNTGTWVLTLSTTSAFAVSNLAAVADTTPNNYRVLLEVFAFAGYDDGPGERVAQLQGHPDPDGVVWFDLSSVLAGFVRDSRAEPLCPAYGTPLPVRADNIRRYYYRATEEYGDPPVVQPWVYGTVRRVMDAGVSQSIFAEGDYLGGITSDTSLLTWQADGQRVKPGDELWLPWYNYTGADKSLVLERTLWSATTGLALNTAYMPLDETIPPVAVARCKAGQVIQFPLRDALDASAYDDGAVHKVTVRVVDGDSDWDTGSPVALSGSRTYYLDWAYHESERLVQWINSFGTVETLRCTGDFTKQFKTERQVARRNLAPGADVYATDTFQFGRSYRPTFTYRTGYIRRADAETLQEMLLAGDIYDVSAGGYVPLRVLTDSWRVTETQEDLHAYEFEAALRLDLVNFSKRPATTDGGEVWQEPSGAAWLDALALPWELP